MIYIEILKCYVYSWFKSPMNQDGFDEGGMAPADRLPEETPRHRGMATVSNEWGLESTRIRLGPLGYGHWK